jgi:DNA polymerase-3 subunit gamma/tau
MDRDRARALQLLEAALTDGVQLEALTDQFVGYFRDLMVTACGAVEAPLLSVGTDQRPKLQQQAARWGLSTIVAAMQIMADAKGRMQRVTYGRALAELALVRISMLEDLDRLDDLVARLRGGTVSSLPSPAPRSAPPATAIPNAASSGEKKNDLAQPARSEIAQSAPKTADATEAIPPSPPVDSAEIAPLIEWKTGCEKELHTAVLGRLTDMTGTHLSRVCRTAISGPTQLDFYFPANYDLDRRQCDRPEVVQRLEQIVSEIVGKRVRVRFQVSEAVAEEPVKAAAAPAKSSAKSQFVELPDDPYLQDITNVFGIKIWKVQPLIVDPNSEG